MGCILSPDCEEKVVIMVGECNVIGNGLWAAEENIRAKVEQVGQYYERYFESMLNDLIKEGVLEQSTDAKARARQLYGFLLGQLTMARIQNSLDPLASNLKEGLLRIAGLI